MNRRCSESRFTSISESVFKQLEALPRRSTFKRGTRDIKRGCVQQWGDHMPSADEVATRVSYRGNEKHKNYPAPNGEWTPRHSGDAANCAHFVWSAWPELAAVLRESIRRSCVQFDQEEPFPVRAWAYINDVLHEARITNARTGEYHGFPLQQERHKPLDPHNLLADAPRVTIPTI